MKAEPLPRHNRDEGELPIADWDEACAALRGGEAGPYWLSVARDDGGPHVRPVFAAWAGSSFFFVSKGSAAKTGHLERHPDATVSVDLGPLHLVVEGRVARVTDPDRLLLASRTLEDVFGWPTEVAGDELDAAGGAPSSGGPPYRVYELTPVRAYGFPTRDQVEPTRWTFD